MAGVRDFIRDIDHLRLEGGLGVGLWKRVETFANFVSQIEAIEFRVLNLQLLDHAQALATTTKAPGILHQLVEGVFHRMTEGWMAKIAG